MQLPLLTLLLTADGRSGTEDDIFETAAESLKVAGGASLTWEQAMELASTWKRQHSTENLLEAVERDGQKRRHPSRDAYERLYNGRGEDEDEDDEDDDGSSTEVEGGMATVVFMHVLMAGVMMHVLG